MDLFEQHVRVLLRDNLLTLSLAVIITVAGIASLVLYRVHGKLKEPILLWFGVFVTIYGIRQLAKNDLIPLAIGGPREGWLKFIWALDYVITVPAMLQVEQLYGPGWRNSVRWGAWILAIYGAAGIASLPWVRSSQIVPDPGRVLAMPLLLAIVLLSWIKGYRLPRIPDGRVLLAGTVVFLVSVLMQQYASERLQLHTIEPVGFFLFLLSLAILAIRRVLRDRRRLFAVEEEMASARRIQSSILPSSEPRLAGLTIAARYSPMASVAGDFYDFLPIDSDRVGILVADVAGHGVPAALIASMVKVALGAQQEHAADPGEVISGLNQVFCKQLGGHYITAGYLVVDTRARTGTYAGAAHPPLIVHRKAADLVERFENNGLLLGFRPKNAYSNLTVALHSGDRVLLYTDGLIEAENPAGESFESQVDARIAAHAGLSADRFADAMVEELEKWSAPGSTYNPADDLTLVVVDVA